MIVVPDGPDPTQPVASDQTLAAVAAYLDKFRLVTTELYVTRPVYRLVEIQARVIVNPGASSGAVETALLAALLSFYNPLTGGQKPQGATQGTGWDFGGTIYVSDAYGQILSVAGVQRIDGAVQIYVDGQLQPQDQDTVLQPFELVYSDRPYLGRELLAMIPERNNYWLLDSVAGWRDCQLGRNRVYGYGWRHYAGPTAW